MARDHRIVNPNGTPVLFSCENRRFRTNLLKGFSHMPYSETPGSVLQNSLIDSNGYTLWLEHVIDKASNEEIYWLMWYDPDGKPTIPMSGVFGKVDLEQMVAQLTRFVP